MGCILSICFRLCWGKMRALPPRRGVVGFVTREQAMQHNLIVVNKKARCYAFLRFTGSDL
jgi:hypothetical protein